MNTQRRTDRISRLERSLKTPVLFLVCVVGLNVTLYADSGRSGIKQFGTSDYEWATGVAVDSSGNVYVTGTTTGALTGTNAGDDDVFLTKYDYYGNRQWMVQIGTSLSDYGDDVAVDSSGNVYVTGYTEGALTGTNAGDFDIFLTKYDSSGTQQWMRQTGTSSGDNGVGVAVDSSGNVYVTGSWGAGVGEPGSNILLTKYDTSGTQEWIETVISFPFGGGSSVAVDSSGNVYVQGYTMGDLGGTGISGEIDIFLTKYDSNGTQQWIKQIGTSGRASPGGVAVDSSGNAFMTGRTEGAFTGTNAGGRDIFLTKYDSSGTQQWMRQTGTSSNENAGGVALDSSGNVYVTGLTSGALTGTNAGGQDIFLTKYNSSGTQQWIRQIGTSEDDGGDGVAVDSSGNVYVTGRTEGDLGGTNYGEMDIFLLKYDTSGNLQ